MASESLERNVRGAAPTRRSESRDLWCTNKRPTNCPAAALELFYEWRSIIFIPLSPQNHNFDIISRGSWYTNVRDQCGSRLFLSSDYSLALCSSEKYIIINLLLYSCRSVSTIFKKLFIFLTRSANTFLLQEARHASILMCSFNYCLAHFISMVFRFPLGSLLFIWSWSLLFSWTSMLGSPHLPCDLLSGLPLPHPGRMDKPGNLHKFVILYWKKNLQNIVCTRERWKRTP